MPADGSSVAARPESTEAVPRFMAEAVEAGGYTPETMSAGEAAEAVCRHEPRHPREAHERATGARMQRPGRLAD